MMRKIDTKANVLKRLKISNSKIPFLISFTEKNFLNRKDWLEIRKNNISKNRQND